MAQDSPFKTADQKKREREAKRGAVLRAAVRMFNEHGFHATSLDDVAASLGITKRTIYHYLASKDQVLLECVTIGLNQLLEAASEARQEPGTGRDRLAKFMRRYAEINMEDFGRCVIRTGEEALAEESVPKFRALKRKIDDAMRELLEAAIADRSIAPVDPKIAAFTLAGALNWPARWFEAGGPMSKEQVANHMVELLINGLLPSRSD